MMLACSTCLILFGLTKQHMVYFSKLRYQTVNGARGFMLCAMLADNEAVRVVLGYGVAFGFLYD